MKKMFKKVLSMTMATMMAVGLCATPVFADEYPSKKVEIELADGVEMLDDVRLNLWCGLWCVEGGANMGEFSTAWGEGNTTWTYATVEEAGKYTVDMSYNVSADDYANAGVQVLVYDSTTIKECKASADNMATFKALLEDEDCTKINIKVTSYTEGGMEVTDATPVADDTTSDDATTNDTTTDDSNDDADTNETPDADDDADTTAPTESGNANDVDDSPKTGDAKAYIFLALALFVVTGTTVVVIKKRQTV